MQEDEIAEAKWMPLEEFLNLPFYKGLYKRIIELGKESVENNYQGIITSSLPLVFRKGTNLLYHNKPKL